MNLTTTPGRRVLAAGLRPTRRGAALGAGAFALHQLCEAAVPVTVGLVIDRAVARGDVASAGRWVLVLVVLFAVLSSAWQAASWWMTRAAQRTEHLLRLRVVERALDPRGSQRRTTPGEVLSLATSDAARVGSVVEVIGVLVASSVALAASAAVLLSTSVLLGVVTLVTVVVVVALTPLLTGPLQRRSDAEQEAVARASGVATDLVDGLRPLTGLGMGPAASERFRVVSGQAREARLSASVAEGAVRGTTTALSGMLLVAVAAVGAHQVLDGELTTGELVSAVGLAQFLVGVVQRLAWGLTGAARVRASAARLGALLEAEPQVQDAGGPAAGGPGALSLRGVRSGALDGLDLDVVAGQVLGVVAEEACAADLLALLSRRRDPEQGVVSLDGAPLTAVALDALRSRVRVCPHEGHLFAESVTEALGVDPDAVPGLLASVAAGDVLAATGLTEPLGERGRTLSGGQRQRLALARALAADPAVLVLHEPTTAVDPATEALLAQGLRERRAGLTTVLVTTSPALLAVADRVVLLTGASVTAQGTHAELAHDPAYAALVLA